MTESERLDRLAADIEFIKNDIREIKSILGQLFRPQPTGRGLLPGASLEVEIAYLKEIARKSRNPGGRKKKVPPKE